MRVAVYAIAKDEEKFAARFCESAKEADLILVADTGSTDRTVEVLRNHGAVVQEICVTPWRFDVARNAALSLLPKDIDVCVSLDLDEVLAPGWRQRLEKAWKVGTSTRLRYQYDWGSDVVFLTDKVHARSGYRWKHPCHETLAPDPRLEEVFAESYELFIQHLPDSTKSRAQYLPLLEVGVKEDPNDLRNSFYYARELTFAKEWQKAVDELTRYLALPGCVWSDERGYAMRLLGQSYDALGLDKTALHWYRRAAEEAPHRRESWVDLAEACHDRALWSDCYCAAKRGIDTTGHRDQWPTDANAWSSRPYDLAALAAYWLGKKEDAVSLGRKAVELDPSDERLRSNLLWYEKKADEQASPLEKLYEDARACETDINEHLPILKALSAKAESVTELGTRTGQATVALLSGQPKTLTSYDAADMGVWQKLAPLSGKTSFVFSAADTLSVEIAPTDLLFLNTLHTYEQLSKELRQHASKVRKWIVLHETTTFGEFGEVDGSRGVWPAVEEFLAEGEFELVERLTNNNGLTILERKS